MTLVFSPEGTGQQVNQATDANLSCSDSDSFYYSNMHVWKKQESWKNNCLNIMISNWAEQEKIDDFLREIWFSHMDTWNHKNYTKLMIIRWFGLSNYPVKQTD